MRTSTSNAIQAADHFDHRPDHKQESGGSMAGQRITFGWHLDGQRALQPTDSLGVSVVGPLGFLSILETQLGLLTLHPSQAE